ncbi:unnamed protein product [Symbiodinium sp. CCMP2592]|nr:unnamed protein product [Symbiodinium sp. CCMP2592]
MPPKKGANDQPSTKGGAGKGKDRTEAQVTRVDFGLPSSMVQTLQSISSRATQDLWGQGSFTTDGATVEQLAQRTANTLGRLSKRLNGNMRAKKDRQDALTAWVSMLSQHLLGLTHRVDALSRKVDEDTIAAAEELRHVSAAQPSATTNEQLARAEQALGPVWTDPQVQEVHRLAAALKAFATTNPSSLDMHPGPGGSVALLPRGTLGAPLQPATAMSATLMPPVPLGPPAAHPGGFGSGGSEASFGTPERSTGVGESEARSGRWRKRSGGGVERPSKSPRRDLPRPPWPRESTGRTPEAPPRAPVTVVADEGLDGHAPLKCTDVLPRVRQGLLVASLLTTGGLLDPFSFAPSTAQEWLFPSLLLEAEVQLRGFVARDASQDPRVQVLLRLPSPFLGAALAEELDKELEWRCLILCIALYRVAVVSERFLATYGPQLSWRRSWQLSCTLSATAWWVAALFGPPTSMFACACISELLAFLPGLALDLGSTRLGHLCTCACPGGFASRMLGRAPGMGLRAVVLAAVAAKADRVLVYLAAVVWERPFSSATSRLWMARLCTLVFSSQPPARGFRRRCNCMHMGFMKDVPFSAQVLSCPLPLWMLCVRFIQSAGLVIFFFPARTATADTWLSSSALLRERLFSSLAPSRSLWMNGSMVLSCTLGEQLLLSPVTCTWRQVWLPVDLRSIAQLAMTAQEVRADLVSLPTYPTGPEVFHGTVHPGLSSSWLVLTGNFPLVLMFFPHVFRQDSSSSSEEQADATPGSAFDDDPEGDFGEGPLWRLEFSGLGSAREAAAEIYRQAIRLGRPQVVAASAGPTSVVCAELPSDYTAAQVLRIAQQACEAEEVQILKGFAHRLRHGDVVRIAAGATARTLDVSAFVLPSDSETASRWLQTSRLVSILHPSDGVLTFEVPRSADLTTPLLRALLGTSIPGKHVFLEVPGADALPHSTFAAVRPGQDCIIYRLTDVHDPSAVGLFMAFAGVFSSFPVTGGLPFLGSARPDLVSLWCDAWHVKCLITCIPGFTAWALREGSSLLGMCTPAPSWEAVATALDISLWELPHTFLSDNQRVWPYPSELSAVATRCVSVGYDSHEGVAQLWTLPDGCLQLRRDFARPCTMSWTHELSRQTYGFAVASPHLGAYIARTCPSSEVQMHLWLPGQGPIHLRVAAQHLGAHLGAYLGGFLPACEYGLHAFDSNPQVLDLIIAPPGAAAWWIVKDTIGCELLRPVVQHYVSHCSFFFCAIEPDGAVYSVEPSAEVRFMTPSPHGARALVAKVLPGLVGRVVDGVLQVVAAKAGSMSLAGGLALLLLSGQAASMQTVPELPLVPAVEPPTLPAIMRIWTLNVRQPVDLPWRAEGYPTRWLRDLMRRLHSIDDPGEFRSTCGPRDSGVQHVLFVPLVPPTVPRNRFWLLHWGEAAVVAFGHTPFSWDVVSAHLRTLFPGGQVPDRCPAIAYAGAFYPPGAALPDLPSGAIIQLLTGALARVPSEDDPWHPEPYVVDGPWFQHVPSKGPALEPAILIDAGGSRRPDGYVPTTLVDQGTQTDLSGNGTGLDHATVSRVHSLAQELTFHTSRLWAGLAEPDAEPADCAGPVSRPPEITAAAAALPPDVDLLDMGSPSGCQRGAASSWALLVLLGTLGHPRLGLLFSLLHVSPLCRGSYILPGSASSDEEPAPNTSNSDMVAVNMSSASSAPTPFSQPAGPPPPDPVNAPFQPRLLFLRAARPLEDYALGLWPSPVDREPAADEDAVRRVHFCSGYSARHTLLHS